MTFSYDPIRAVDEQVANALQGEQDRQEQTLAMIASENHVSENVLRAQGSELTNKYAEGYPDSRYYAGCEYADEIEQLAIDRAKQLWGAEHVNVQPHAGTQANQAVYLAELDTGDTILSLKLSHGGHLSHGSPVNFTGQMYTAKHYSVNTENGRLDYTAIEQRAHEVQPDMLVSGFSAYPRTVDFERMQEIAESVDATHVADIAHITGLVASGEHPSPVGVADYVTGSTHKTIRAGRGGIIMTREENADKLDKAVFPGSQGGPAMHSVAGKAVGFGEALEPAFDEYSSQVIQNATALGDELSAGGFELVSGGTDNHLVLIDFQQSHPELTGKHAEELLTQIGIISNKNTVPGDSRSPFVTSGLRLGTPAITTRGLGEREVRTVGKIICSVLNSDGADNVINDARMRIEDICDEYPVYAD